MWSPTGQISVAAFGKRFLKSFLTRWRSMTAMFACLPFFKARWSAGRKLSNTEINGDNFVSGVKWLKNSALSFGSLDGDVIVRLTLLKRPALISLLMFSPWLSVLYLSCCQFTIKLK
jgi:hypothetical protein